MIFGAAMTGLSAGVVEAVVQSYDFSGGGVLVNVGGGEGTLLAAILAATRSCVASSSICSPSDSKGGTRVGRRRT